MITGIYSTAPSLWIPNNTSRTFDAHSCGKCDSARQTLAASLASESILSLLLLDTDGWKVQPFTFVHHIGSRWGGYFAAEVEESAVNKNRNQILHGLEQLSEEEQLDVLGNDHPNFKYTL